MIQVARIAALQAMRSVRRLRQTSTRSATERPFGMTTVLNFKVATAANRGPRSADTDAPINNGATSRDGELENWCVALVWLERFNEDRSRKLVAVLLVAWTAMISRRLRTRPHSPQDAILDDVVMEKRRSGVKQHHRDNDICYDASHALTLRMKSSSPNLGKCHRLNSGNACANTLVMPSATMISNSRSSSRCVVTASR